MARLRASWRTSLPVVQQPRNPQSESIARSPYDSSCCEGAPAQSWRVSVRRRRPMVDATALLGTWKMVSWTREVVGTGETSGAMGPNPIGYIAYHADGRMMACRPPIEMSPLSPFEMSLFRVTDPPQRGRATPTSSAALLSARVSNGEEGRARYPAHE